MLFTTTEFCRSTGIGSKLFAWSRAKIFEHDYKAIMLQQHWISIRGAAVTRGGIDYMKVFGKIYLFNNFVNDTKEMNPLFFALRYRHNCQKIMVSNLQEARQFVKSDNKLIVFKWNTDHFFTDFELYRKLITDSIYRITRKPITNHLVVKEPFIGINVRLGNDFVEQDATQHGYRKTAIQWFLDHISEVRKLHGNLPIYVVSDGTHKQLSDFTRFDNVVLVNNNRAMEDLLLLSKASVFMGSGNSTFSAWASFLGNMPTYSSKETPFTSFKLSNTYEL